MTHRKAFTLIELLIVVAIIAILAAIAVPNFLEAQTRAKISRARSDMRSLATALEAYRVDYNKYAPMLGDSPGQVPNRLTSYGPVRSNAWRGVPQNITTPIAYMTSIPADGFKQGKVSNLAPNLGKRYSTGNPFDETFVYHNIRQYVDFDTAGVNWNQGDITDYGEWRLVSLGPRGVWQSIGTGDPTRGWLYDPTNGTVSNGMIIRTQMDTVGARFTR